MVQLSLVLYHEEEEAAAFIFIHLLTSLLVKIMFCGMLTPTLLVLWLFNFNIYFCGGYSAHNGYPGHCFRLSPSHRNLLRGGDLLLADASEWGVSQNSRERADNSYLSKSETLGQKQRKMHQVLRRRRRNQKTWGEVEKES